MHPFPVIVLNETAAQHAGLCTTGTLRLPASGGFEEVPGFRTAEDDPSLDALPVEKHAMLPSLFSLLVKLHESRGEHFS